MRALQIEFIKLLRPSTFIISGILILILILQAVGSFYVNAPKDVNALIARIDTNQVSDIFMIFSIFIILNIAKEYSDNTLRRSVIEGYSRDEFFTGKLLLIIVTGLIVLVVQKAVFLCVAAYINHFKAAIEYLSGSPAIISGFIKITFYGVFALFLAFLTRSVALGIVLYFVWTIIEGILFGLLLFKYPQIDWAAYLPTRSLDSLLNINEFIALKFVLVPGAYILLMMLSSYVLLLKRDIK
jgi:hypothetical protein